LRYYQNKPLVEVLETKIV